MANSMAGIITTIIPMAAGLVPIDVYKRQAVNRAEDQLTLAPSVAGVDHLCHIRPAHQLPQNVKLLLLFRADDEAERGRNDGQRRQRPFGITA